MNLSLVDPELAVALAQFPQMDIWSDLPLSRKLIAQARLGLMAALPAIENVTSTDYRVPSMAVLGASAAPEVSVRVYRPEDQTQRLPALLWIHGGGYCLGSMEQDDYLVRQMVKEVGCAVVSVDYRLAPEHPFPAPLDDCYSALCWLFSNTEQLKVDGSRIGIGGISAGAGLAAGLALLARDQGEVLPIFQALLCPMIDDRSITPSSHSITDERVWNRNSNIKGWQAYLGPDMSGGAETPSAYAAPSRAEDLTGLPKAYIAVGSVDAFVDENTDYAERLNAAGVDTQFEIFPGGFHAFEFTVPGADISRLARDCHYQAIKKGLF
jgi:acetyl esterase/lipase